MCLLRVVQSLTELFVLLKFLVFRGVRTAAAFGRSLERLGRRRERFQVVARLFPEQEPLLLDRAQKALGSVALVVVRHYDSGGDTRLHWAHVARSLAEGLLVSADGAEVLHELAQLVDVHVLAGTGEKARHAGRQVFEAGGENLELVGR